MEEVVTATSRAGMRSRAWRGLMIVIFLGILEQGVEAFHITVQQSQSECISEHVGHDGDTVSGNFVVIGKHLDWYSDKDDIEMVVSGPSGNKIMSAKARGGQKFEFKAQKLGRYKFCFMNPTAAPEDVDFVIHVGHTLSAQDKDVAKDEHFNPVEAKIVQLREALERVSLEQQYYKSRDVRHRLTNESTQNRLLWYTLTEYMVLILLSGTQVYLIQKLFSKRIGYNRV